MPEQRGALVPRHAITEVDDVIAGQGADGNADYALDSQLAAESQEFIVQPRKDIFAIADQIHFVDGRDDIDDARAERRCKRGAEFAPALHAWRPPE